MEAKIAKTEHSISKLETHLENWSCPKSLQYTTKPNNMPDNIFDREIMQIKQMAEQGLVNAFTCFQTSAQEPD